MLPRENENTAAEAGESCANSDCVIRCFPAGDVKWLIITNLKLTDSVLGGSTTTESTLHCLGLIDGLSGFTSFTSVLFAYNWVFTVSAVG